MPICTARTAACVHARWHVGGGLSTVGAIYSSAGSPRLRARPVGGAPLERGRAGSMAASICPARLSRAPPLVLGEPGLNLIHIYEAKRTLYISDADFCLKRKKKKKNSNNNNREDETREEIG